MSTRLDDLVAKNKATAQTHTTPPYLKDLLANYRDSASEKAFIIIACSDPRVVPEQFIAGFPSAVIRNAGGRTQDAIRSILALNIVANVGTIVVIHHTDCGMCFHDEQGFIDNIRVDHAATLDKAGITTIGAISDPAKTVVEDVKFLKSFDTLNDKMRIIGMILDLQTGLLKVADV